jgi:pimeloyl-ACP methyl ester carboxylesterase
MAPLTVPALRAAGGLVEGADEAWLRAVNGLPGTARAFARTVRDVIDWHGQKRHFLDRAREIQQFPPTALFWGSRDRVIPYEHAIKAVRVMRGAELSTFVDCGHFLHHESPQKLAGALTSFMASSSARPVRCLAPEAALPLRSRSIAARRRALRRAPLVENVA